MEKTVIPIVCVLGLAVFIVLASVLGKKAGFSTAKTTPIPTAEPTERPYITAASSMAGETSGELLEGSDFSAVTFKSSIDDEPVKVNYYLKSGVLCVKLARSFSVREKLPDETPYDDPFSDDEPIETCEPPLDMEYLEKAADELLYCIGFAYLPSEPDTAKADIISALSIIYTDTANKAETVFGVYLLKFSYSEADKLLTVVCEPS